MLTLILQSVAGSPLSADAAVVDAVYRLGFSSWAEIAAGTEWVTPAELYAWADEEAKKLAYEAGVFVTNDTSITVTGGTAVYGLPASHVFTMAAALGNTPLRITPVRELWALDGCWPATTGPAMRCSFDAGSVGTITLYPIPNAGGTLSQVCQEFPADLVAGGALPLPAVLQDLFTYAILGGARGKESDAAMPEMAAHFGERVKLYEQVAEHLWGPGQ
jgi:hypothetical protein